MMQKLIEDITYEELRHIIESYSANRIFLVSGKKSFELSGANEFIELATIGKSIVRFSDFEQNPKYEQALKGTKLFLDSNCDIIIAIGGGSVMDMAKLINIFAANPELDGLEIVKDSSNIQNSGKTLIALPTTAGTGSEATHFAVVYHDSKKYSVAHPSLLPKVAGLNPELTRSQPKYLTACAGLDALSQAIESYWSVNANEESQQYAERAIVLLIQNLEKAVNHPEMFNRKQVMYGAFLAGKAINISKTTAAHAVSYAFTTYYAIPHGHAVFLTLPEFMEYNSRVSEEDMNDPRGYRYTINSIKKICKILKVDSAFEAKQFLRQLAADIGVELSLIELGVVGYESKIVDNVNMERLGNNPRKIGRSGLLELLASKTN